MAAIYCIIEVWDSVKAAHDTDGHQWIRVATATNAVQIVQTCKY